MCNMGPSNPPTPPYCYSHTFAPAPPPRAGAGCHPWRSTKSLPSRHPDGHAGLNHPLWGASRPLPPIGAPHSWVGVGGLYGAPSPGGAVGARVGRVWGGCCSSPPPRCDPDATVARAIGENQLLWHTISHVPVSRLLSELNVPLE